MAEWVKCSVRRIWWLLVTRDSRVRFPPDSPKRFPSREEKGRPQRVKAGGSEDPLSKVTEVRASVEPKERKTGNTEEDEMGTRRRRPHADLARAPRGRRFEPDQKHEHRQGLAGQQTDAIVTTRTKEPDRVVPWTQIGCGGPWIDPRRRRGTTKPELEEKNSQDKRAGRQEKDVRQRR